MSQGQGRPIFTATLLEGTVALTLADGSALWVTYRGTATVGITGQSRASLDGEITGGTGTFAGARGSLKGTGSGGFVNDGEFSANLHASLSTDSDPSMELAVALDGSSTSTCSTTAPPRMALDGRGRGRRFEVAAHLEHNLVSQVCAIIVP